MSETPMDEVRPEPKAYEPPKVERLGNFAEKTQAGGAFNPGDGINPFNRYTPIPG